MQLTFPSDFNQVMMTNHDKKNGSELEETSELVKLVFNHGNDLSKETALQLCSDHLEGEWSHLSIQDIDVSVIQGGFVNRIFLIRNIKSDEKVLIRLYGGKLVSKNALSDLGIEAEVLMYQLISEVNVGPKILGIFEGGRIEEYLEGSDILSETDIQDKETMACLARQQARLHSLTVPMTKKPKDMIRIIREKFKKHWSSYVKGINETPLPEGYPEEVKKLIEKTKTYDFMATIDWFADLIPTVKHRVVFSHNDTNRGNYLIVPSRTTDDKVILCDFEFSGYNYRGSDIGGHFRARTQDLKKFTSYVGNKDKVPEFNHIPYPTEQERRVFIKEYLKKWKELNPAKFDPELDSEENILLEAEVFNGTTGLYFMACLFFEEDNFFKKLFKMHPGLLMAGIIKDLEERKQRITDLRSRYSV